MDPKKPLEGIKVIDMSTFVAVPMVARILADYGAEVIKVESPAGDLIRYNGASEGRSASLRENTTYDYLNANKKDIALNLKAPKAREVFDKLISEADIFVTNWRDDALERQNLDYENMKKVNPKIIYGTFTGYGSKGPDKDLPGYDFTAFFGRGGLLGTLYQKGTVPFNTIPGLGDLQSAMMLCTGIMIALFKAQKTGVGDKVSCNLYHASVYTQALMIMAAQYEGLGEVYPIDRRFNTNPFNVAYKSSDERFVQLSMPPYDLFYNKFMKIIEREDLIDHPIYSKMAVLSEKKLACEVYDVIWEAFGKKTAAEWDKILVEADIPHSVAYTWEEILVDEQAWANDFFYKMPYTTGNERVLVRLPFSIDSVGLPEYNEASQLGQDGPAILKEMGYSDEEIKQMEENKELVVDRRFI